MSLLPSATEIVAALGHAGQLVGRSAECDFPEEVGALPVVMRARHLDAERPSSEIDARVTSTRRGGESLYILDIPLLRTLAPDLILTQDLCGVCSVTEAEVTEACAQAGVHPRILTLTPRTLHDVLENILAVGHAIGAEIAARGLVEALEARAVAVRERGSPGNRSIAVVEWLDPPILAGLWTPQMLEIAGAPRPAGPADGQPGERTTWAELQSTRPDVLVLSPCSFRIERTLREISLPGFRPNLERFREGSVWVADEAYFSRPGPRLWSGLELVADLTDGRSPRAPLPLQSYRLRPREVAA